MKKAGIAIAIIVLVGLGALGVLYVKNNRAAEAGAEKALTEYRSRPLLATWERPEAMALLLERARTLDSDGAEDIVNAARPYQDPEARSKLDSDSITPDDVPEIALLETAGASQTCNLTGGVAPIPDNPYETEIVVYNELISLGEIMVAKAETLENEGLHDEAENELLLLLSVGAHLEEDAAWTSMAIGLAMQQTALEALADLYAGRGEGSAESADRVAAIQRSVEAKREAIERTPPFLEMSLSDEGLEELSKIAHDDSLPRAIRLEAIMGLNAGHLFDINRIVLGPDSKRIAVVNGLNIDDPVLTDVASKARAALLEMPFSDRRQSVTTISVIE